MNRLNLSQLVRSLGGHQVGADVTFSAVNTDTRSLAEGDLFVALQGENFDAHAFIAEAERMGAVALIVNRQVDSKLPQLVVANTRKALGDLAAIWRQAFPCPMIAVTGSNGKTTVKEMMAAILRQRGNVLATLGNFNNDIGMPLTLLRHQDEAYAVIEMGANHPGEIRYLTEIAKPDVAVITNAGEAHLEGFGDLRGVAQAKGEIIEGVSKEGTLVLNDDDVFCDYWRDRGKSRAQVSFGLTSNADVYAYPETISHQWADTGVQIECRVKTPQGDLDMQLALAGQHNLINALAAVAATQVLGASNDEICAGLKQVKAVKGRLYSQKTAAGEWLIDDTYNANPSSVSAAISVLKTAPGRHCLVLGDLAELGSDSEHQHRELGVLARAAGIDYLFSVGDASAHAAKAFGEGGEAFTSKNSLINRLKEKMAVDVTVLIKGSRSAAMEQVVDALLEEGRG